MRIRSGIGLAAFAGIMTVSQGVFAQQETIKIGILGQFSGPFALIGKQYRQGIETYTATYGSKVGGRDVELVYRDIGGTNASVAKRLAEEMIVRDRVSIIGGFYLSPEPLAVAPVLTETKTPGVVFNGAAKSITEASPYIIRSGNTQFQMGYVEAEWAIKRGYKRAYVAVSDYAPGYDLLEAFRKRYTSLGGEILGEDKMPLNTVDYAPYVERIARAKPTLFKMFIPAGAPSVNMVKSLQAQGMTGRKDLAIIGQAQLEEAVLNLFDDSVVGMYDALTYSIEAPHAENRKYKGAMRTKFGAAELPSFAGATAWDGMHIIYRMIREQAGKPFDGTTAINVARGFNFEGARGNVRIEPDTRNATLDIHIRRAVKGAAGKLKLEVADIVKGVKSLP
jgi:branched-chain amino acid transport system substrate-binding protein